MHAIVNAEALARALAAVAPAAAADKTAPADLRRILVEVDADAVLLVATDGKRMHMARVPAVDCTAGVACVDLAALRATPAAVALGKVRVAAANATADRLGSLLGTAVEVATIGGHLCLAVFNGDERADAAARVPVAEPGSRVERWREVARPGYGDAEHATHVAIDPTFVGDAAAAAHIFARKRGAAVRALAPTASRSRESLGPVYFMTGGAGASGGVETPDRFVALVMPMRTDARTPADPLAWLTKGDARAWAPPADESTTTKRAAGSK